MFISIIAIASVIALKMHNIDFTSKIEDVEVQQNATMVENEKIVEQNLSENIKTYDKVVALTFDDGPSRYTNRVKEILNKYNAKATFFMLGANLNTNYSYTLKDLIKDGFEIGIHGYSHKMLNKLSKNKLDKEINYTRKLLEDITNTKINLVRPPYGSYNKNVINNYDGYYILWNIDPKDWKLLDANKVYESIINNVNDGDIILMHETYLSSVSALELIIPELQEMGYEIVTVSKLAELKNVTLENHKVYHSFK